MHKLPHEVADFQGDFYFPDQIRFQTPYGHESVSGFVERQ